MATVTRPAVPLPNPGDDIDAEQVRDWITNTLSFLESTNIDEANVDLTGVDGIMGKSTSQTITGLKTFESTAAAAGGIREVMQLGLDPASGTASDNDGGRITFYADDDSGAETDIASLDWVFTDTTDGSEDSRIDLRAIKAGTLATVYSGGYAAGVGSHTMTVRDAASASTLDSFILQWDPDSGTAQDNQGISLVFNMADDGGNQTNFATIDTVATDVSNGSEDSKLVFNVLTAGSNTAALTVDGSSVAVPSNLTVGGTLTLTGGISLNGNTVVGDSASDTLTVNSTITSNLIFTDATYDIGASGATRPRDLHLSRNALMGGTLGVTGLLTATAGVTSGSNIVSDTDSTDDLGTTSVRWANLYVDSIGDTGQALAITAGSNNVNVTAGTLALTGAQTISSTLGVTGLITASGGVSGALTGNVTGNISGNVTGGTISGTSLTINAGTSSVGATVTASTGQVELQTGGQIYGYQKLSVATAGMQIKGYSDGGATKTQTAGISLLQTANSAAGGYISFLTHDGSSVAERAKLNSVGDFSLGGSAVSNGTGSTVLNVNGSSGGATIHLTNSTTGTTNSDGALLVQSGSDLLFINRESGNLKLRTADTDRLIIDSSGNTGLGVTPSAWGGSFKALQVNDSVFYNNNGGDTFVGSNYYWDGANNKYINTDYSAAYGQQAGAHIFYTAPSGTAGNTVSFTQAMTLTNAGLVGIGTESPASGGTDTQNVHVHNSTSHATYFKLSNNATGATNADGFDMIMGTSSDAYVYNRENGPIIFGTNAVEKMRITSAGNLLVGGTSQNGSPNRAAVFSADKFGLSIIDTTAQAAGVGGALNLGGNYRSAGDAQAFARVEAVKENATDANYAYGMAFSVTPNGASSFSTEALRITSAGLVKVLSDGLAINGQNTTHEANSLRIGQEGSGLAQFRAYGPDTSNRGSIEFATDLSNGTAKVRHITLKDVNGESGVGVGTQSPLARVHTALGTANLSSVTSNTQAIFEHTAADSSISRVAIVAGAATGFSVLDFGDIAATNAGGITYSHQYDRMSLSASGGTTRASIDSDGLKFGTATAAASALDYYEEGTFSVGIAGSTSAGSATVSSTAGYYTRIGNVVHAFGFVSWNSATGTGNLKITGLPFTSSSSGQYYPAGSMTSADLTFSHTITPYVSIGSTFMQIQQSQSGATATFVQVDASATIYFNVTYFV